METVVECKRGEMWYIRDGESFGHEEASRRAVVIISSDRGVTSSPVVQVAYSTTKRRTNGTAVEVHSTRPWSWILCEQLAAVDKRRLMTKICDLTEAEMLKVELGLRTVLGLSSKPSESDALLQAREAEFSEKTIEFESKIAELELELTVHKKLYEKAVDKIVGLKFEKDTNREPVVALEDKPFEVEPPEMKEPELDLSGLAEKFKVYDERQKTKKTVKVEPVKAECEKVNVNTVDWKTLMGKVGLCEQTAKQVVNYRLKNGSFTNVTDLVKVPRVTQTMLNRIIDLIEV
jgi:mRNA-degrading endonuclease toxin of MazEF toxin-antitoxin module